MSNSRAFVSVTSVQLSSLPSRRAGRLLLPRILCLDGFFSVSLDLTTPLRTNPKLRPHPIDLTHADGDAKGGLEFSLDAARSKLWVGGAELGETRSRWVKQIVRMAVANVARPVLLDPKRRRLNSHHHNISHAVLCLQKKYHYVRELMAA